ncbi:tumor suppressor candidate 3 [Perkinsus olseni]|uniref:Tumor suppressor candidate 3 n=1 Tax=Perkinsus olseni TaxID=32597 RepID=A0A7J6NNP2_PEROL|nr:tumor suppressor candidate 3 [Perkinsus olseni]
MNAHNSLFFLLFLTIVSSCSATTSSIGEGEAKKNTLQQLTKQAFEDTRGRSAIITLDTDDYKELIIDNPRPYHVFVLITAPQAVCDVCDPIGKSFSQAAISHYMADDDDEEEPVFFVQLDAFNNRDFQTIHGFKSVPHLVHLHEGSKLKHRKSSMEYRIPPAETYHQTQLEPPVGEILDWMNTKTGRHVEVYVSRHDRLMHTFKLASLAVAAVALLLYGLYAARKWSIVCVIAALFIEMISTSGIFYNMLNGMVLVGKGRNGEPEYIMRGFRGQYLGEGLFCSSMMIVSGLSLLVAARAPYWINSRKSRFLSLAFLGLSLVSGWSVWQCYKYKTGMYSSPGWFPQPGAKHGSIRNDQGFSF